MITTVTCSNDMRQALNENLHGLLTGKRKPLIVKEVNNTLGKMLADVKMEMMQNALSGNITTISWYDRNINQQKSLENKKEIKAA
jgi:predicted thioredoxin/glutaredoxin